MPTDFSLELRVSRKKSGLTQADVAHLLDVGQSTISGFEQGQLIPSVEQVVKLSLIYGRSFECLYGEVVRGARHKLKARLETLSQDVRTCASTFNRPHTLKGLKHRLIVELNECDAVA